MRAWLSLVVAASLLVFCALPDAADPPSGDGSSAGAAGNGSYSGLAGNPAPPPDGTVGSTGVQYWLVPCTYWGGVCVRNRQYTWVNDKASNTEGGSGGATPAQVDAWADIAEEADAFTQAKGGTDCAVNWPYTSVNQCKWGKYINLISIHADQQDGYYPAQPGFPAGPNSFNGPPVCGSSGSALTKIGAKVMGQTTFAEGMIRHQSTFTDPPHRLFFSVDNCATPSLSTYLSVMDNSAYQTIAESYVDGRAIGGVDMGTSAAQFGLAGVYEVDIAGPSQSGTYQCGTQGPCGSIVNPTTSDEYGTDLAQVNAYNSMYDSLFHSTGSGGAPMRIIFNGCSSQMATTNTLELENHLFDSSHVIGCEFEMPIYGFTDQHNGVEAQEWVHVINATTQILSDYPGAFANYNNHEPPDSLYVMGTYPYHGMGRILTTVQWMLAWTDGRLIIKQSEDIGKPNEGNVFPVYPEELFSFKPGDGFPAAARFGPLATNCTNCDQSNNQWDSSAATDGNWGSGCDLNDASTDHGAVDLLTTGSAGGATPAGSCLKTGGLAANCTSFHGSGSGTDADCREDWKNHRVGVYCREFDGAYYDGTPITTVFSLASQYIAACFNPSTSPYTLAAADLPRHGSTGYGHQMAFSALTEGTQEILAGTSPCTAGCTISGLTNNWANGGSMNFTTTFTLGAAGNLPGETGVVLVR